MNFTIEEVDKVKILRLREERLDTRIAPDLKAQLLVLLKNASDRLLIDLSEVKYVDSSGLGAILLGLRQARDLNAKYAMFGAQKRVQSLINIAQLGNVLVNYADEKEALKNL
ncbi:MAG TPA: STAS domain-containing protein [bacterium]|nr:STAS domain-containing protein [bacterium]HPN42389.1 STAS domain-containing protein [bacterium]